MNPYCRPLPRCDKRQANEHDQAHLVGPIMAILLAAHEQKGGCERYGQEWQRRFASRNRDYHENHRHRPDESEKYDAV
jgi:hypothetical protein